MKWPFRQLLRDRISYFAIGLGRRSGDAMHAAGYGKPADPAALEASVAHLTLNPENRAMMNEWAGARPVPPIWEIAMA